MELQRNMTPILRVGVMCLMFKDLRCRDNC